MDWFERLTGFREHDYAASQRALSVKGGRLHSAVNGKSYAIGRFEMPSLAELRAQVRPQPGALRLEIVRGDVRELHQRPEYAGALFQVASQFNMLEMPSPAIGPEDGVTGYRHDHTQGPACALACGAATIYRNYLVPCEGGVGQVRGRQLDGLSAVGTALSESTGLAVSGLWNMKNGYALATPTGLAAIARVLRTMDLTGLDVLRGKLRIGVHYGAEVTDAAEAPGPLVSQAFCSALPVAYAGGAPAEWEPFATLVLESAYEATLLVAACNAQSFGSSVALLTMVGGGVFGNAQEWILRALRRALDLARGWELDLKIVSHGEPSAALRSFVGGFQA